MNRQLYLLAVLLAAVVLTACGGDPADTNGDSPDGPPPQITIGHVGHDHQIALFVAALEPGPIEKACGVALVEKKAKEVYDLVENGEVLAEIHMKKVGGGSKMPAAMMRGEIDVGLGGIPAVMFFIDKGAPVKILCPLNVDGDMLLMRPEIPVDDWAAFVKYVRESERPVKIGYKAPVAVAKLVFVGALDAEGIPHGEAGVKGGVELVNCRGGGKIAPSLEKGMIDGAVINEPFGSISVHKKVGKVVSLLADLPPEGRWKNHPCCCICATEDAITNHRKALKALLKLVRATTKFIHENPADASRLAAAWTKNDLAVEQMSVPNIVYLTDAGEGYRAGLKTWLEMMTAIDQFEDRFKGKNWEEAFALGHDLTLMREVTEGR
jgi:sulfonate transport system substrate-binding protein